MDPKKRQRIRDSENKSPQEPRNLEPPNSKNRPIAASRPRGYSKKKRSGPRGRNLTAEQSGENRKYKRLERNPRNSRSEEDSVATPKSTSRHFLNSANRGAPHIQEIQVPMKESANPNITNAHGSRPNSKKPRLRDSARAGNHIYESNNQQI